MSSKTDRSSGIAGRFRGAAGRAGGVAIDGLRTITVPLNRALQPLASIYNHSLGRYFGEMNGLQFVLLFGSLLGLVTIPFWGNYTLVQATWLACIWGIFAMSWDIQSGYTGYISFGHSVLSGGAAYTTAMLVYNVDPAMPMRITVPVSILAALVIGLAIALPSLRLSGPYFSLITFVAVLIFYRVIRPLSDYTGGETGITGIESIYSTDPVMRTYAFMIPMLLIAVALLTVARSNIGLILVAIRENESAVEAAGINATKFKIWSFVLSSIPMGIGGVLLAHRFGTVTPKAFVIVDNSIEMIAMAVAGGMSSILGPLGGAFLIIMLEDVVLAGFESEIKWSILWLIVLAILVFARDGLFRKLWHGLDRLGGDRR
ncbi:branched-chain amino acid ABC transporter permease [Natrinema sp. 1APR25-10V2]|uniref:branched-chain amino acid ABC transporter permease n=1 Tax=Natrinema sp. 1APR25-10V2 TaxID=2951081 RepID=UPI0028754B01|nr:branched-chain amino acid ABC transporter permease [Natrinema sp. 1APR25-10V2]MDS0473952.1 branched-chain amino acid ABC transporter permease [Natrinema sp. 1APR25-10V2]